MDRLSDTTLSVSLSLSWFLVYGRVKAGLTELKRYGTGSWLACVTVGHISHLVHTGVRGAEGSLQPWWMEWRSGIQTEQNPTSQSQ